MIDVNPKTERISTLLKVIGERITKRVIENKFDIEIADSEYRSDEKLPDMDTKWKKFDGVWAGEERDSHYWFKFKIKVPNDRGNYRLNFETSDNQWRWDDCDNPQMLVYIDNMSVQSLDWNHRFIEVESGEHDVCIYAHTGCWVNEIWADEHRSFLLNVSLTEINPEVQGLYYDIKVPFDAAECMDNGDYNRERILNILNDALTIVDVREGSSKFYETVSSARAYIKKNFYENFCEKTDIKVLFTGHAHIDIAWLWPARQSREKAERTFTTILKLMEKYPQMHFYASSPVLYKWLKNNRPDLYKKIQNRISEGRWEADCGTWVEPDLNMPSGESIVRQFLYGKKFLKEEFNIESKILWVPDCFGFAGTLPQIMKGCRVEQLVTTKLGWNDTNKMPHDCFIWRGIDGSEVYAYFITAQDVPLDDGKGNRKSFTTYSSTATPSQTLGAWEAFREKEITSNVHVAFGFGDGGGGPSEEQIEYVERMSYGIPGLPTAKLTSVNEFVDTVQNDMNKHLTECPKWDGELYFELHRGVYTSVAKNKRKNRITEFKLQNAEWLSVAGQILNNIEYPKNEFDECWEKVLEYQFHDIIPGSSIREAYEETDLGYLEINNVLDNIIDKRKKAILPMLSSNGYVVWNNTPFVQTAPVRIGNNCVMAEKIPAHGYKVISEYQNYNSIKVTDETIENSCLKVIFDEKKRIISIYDKRFERELLPDGHIANRLVVYDDIPTYFEAWEIRKQYRKKSYEVDDISNFEIIEDGCRIGLKIERHYMNSIINQTIWMYEDSPILEFETDIDWKEQRALLKAEFPVDINTTKASCDAPYGTVERSITQNTTWEQAKFEVCAHKYVDLSEGNYGVALMTDCKYGYSFKERQMEITLLRTSKHPYPEADLCDHKMRYAFYPHTNGFYTSDVVPQAYVFNNPLSADKIEGGSEKLQDEYSFVSCKSSNVVVDTIKQSEDGNAVVVRLYECGNTRTNTEITFGFDIEKAIQCDMLERELNHCTVVDNKLKITVKPFEIITLKLYYR